MYVRMDAPLTVNERYGAGDPSYEYEYEAVSINGQ